MLLKFVLIFFNLQKRTLCLYSGSRHLFVMVFLNLPLQFSISTVLYPAALFNQWLSANSVITVSLLSPCFLCTLPPINFIPAVIIVIVILSSNFGHGFDCKHTHTGHMVTNHVCVCVHVCACACALHSSICIINSFEVAMRLSSLILNPMI